MSTVVVVIGFVAGLLLLARLRTPSTLGVSPVTGATVSVIIPARNEEISLPHLLGSLYGQEGLHPEVIVVDDGSTDATAAVAGETGARVLQAAAPPTGWLGKPWACHVGADAATGDVLVFLDGDVVLEPDGLARIVTAHTTLAKDGLLSVQPFHRTERAYEQFSLYPNLISMMATGHFAVHRSFAAPMAFGPCVVSTSEAYRAVGGHAAVRGEVLEDLHLGRAFARADRPVRCLAGGSAVSFRMYPDGPRQLVEGWTKNLAGGAALVRPLSLVLSVWWVTASVSAAIEGISWAVQAASGRPTGWLPLLLFALMAAQLTVLARRIGSFRWWAGPAFPLLLSGFLVLLVRSAVQRSLRRRVTWRGRVIHLGRA